MCNNLQMALSPTSFFLPAFVSYSNSRPHQEKNHWLWSTEWRALRRGGNQLTGTSRFWLSDTDFPRALCREGFWSHTRVSERCVSLEPKEKWPAWYVPAMPALPSVIWPQLNQVKMGTGIPPYLPYPANSNASHEVSRKRHPKSLTHFCFPWYYFLLLRAK